MKQFLAGLALAALACAPAMAKPYVVDQANSSIAFAGAHAGRPFEGRLGQWSVTIDFDPANPGASSVQATFDIASAATGEAMFDGTLPQADWFDTANHPQARFATTAIAANADGTWAVTGDLTIRGTTKTITFPLSLSDPAASPVTASAIIEIDRLAFGLGQQSDPKAEWVSQTITVTLALTATAAP